MPDCVFQLVVASTHFFTIYMTWLKTKKGKFLEDDAPTWLVNGAAFEKMGALTSPNDLLYILGLYV